MSFGAAVRERRQELELTLKEVGERTGINSQYLAPVERGDFNPPSDEKIAKIARTLKMDYDALMLLAGRISKKLAKSIAKNPDKAAKLLRGL